MTAKDLKASILQLAIQGKLVAQDPRDEPASALLARITAARTVDATSSSRQKKKSSTKSLPSITDDEKPFDLPEGWAWCRLGEISTLKGGFAFKSSDYGKTGIQVVRISDLLDDAIGTKDTVYYREDDSLSGYLIPKGSILICLTGSIGKMALIKDDVKRYLNQRVGLLSVDASLRDYVWMFLHTQGVFMTWVRSKTSTNGNLKNSDVTDLILPLPPLAEQKRIVAKIEELMPMVERYGAVKEQSDALEAALPDAFRKSVLQYAIQGKLVPQDPNDEPASALLERIYKSRVEVEKCRKGRSKLPPAPQPIPEDEQPFNLPEGWVWVRLRNLGEFCGGHTPSMSDRSLWGGEYLWISSKDMKTKYISDTGDKLSRKGCDELTMLAPGTMIFTTRSGILKHTFPVAILKIEATINQDQKALVLFDKSIVEYIYIAIKGSESRILNDYIKQGTTVQSIVWDRFVDMPIPLPPLAEQKRIVAEVERLLALGEHLKVAS